LSYAHKLRNATSVGKNNTGISIQKKWIWNRKKKGVQERNSSPVCREGLKGKKTHSAYSRDVTKKNGNEKGGSGEKKGQEENRAERRSGGRETFYRGMTSEMESVTEEGKNGYRSGRKR